VLCSCRRAIRDPPVGISHTTFSFLDGKLRSFRPRGSRTPSAATTEWYSEFSTGEVSTRSCSGAFFASSLLPNALHFRLLHFFSVGALVSSRSGPFLQSKDPVVAGGTLEQPLLGVPSSLCSFSSDKYEVAAATIICELRLDGSSSTQTGSERLCPVKTARVSLLRLFFTSHRPLLALLPSPPPQSTQT
jgi:hypothetical protein